MISVALRSHRCRRARTRPAWTCGAKMKRQKGMLTRVWARRGSRPRVPRDYRYGHRDLFSAICPESGISAGHVCDRANTDEMNRHLVDIGSAVPMGRHAPEVLDGAG